MKAKTNIDLFIVNKEIKRRGKENMLKHFKTIEEENLYTKINTPKIIEYLIKYVSNYHK